MLKLNVQFAGTLQYQLQLSEVLSTVLQGSHEDLSALLLTDVENGRYGTIFISQCRYVCGADLKDAAGTQIATGYEALKIICGLVSANFKYVTAPAEYFENADLSLNIEMTKILTCLPRLPNDWSELQSADSLLDRVFSAEDNASKPSIVRREKPAETPAKKSDWHSVPVPRSTPDNPEEDAEAKYATLEERALAELGPPGSKIKKKKTSFIMKVIRRIGFFFYSAYSAPAHLLKQLALPVILPLLAIALLYQLSIFLAPKFRALRLPPTPSIRHSIPERAVRSAPVYRAPQPRKALPIQLPHPAANPETTPASAPAPGAIQHRRAYQTTPQ